MHEPLRRSHLALLLLIASACGGEEASATRGPSGLEVDPFVELSEAALGERIAAARANARGSDRLVLLDFTADWCEDCREVVRLFHEEPARGALESRFVLVYVDIGRGDLHERLQQEHDVDRITALVALDPETGRRVARTTLEPITGADRGLTAAALADWLRGAADSAVQRTP